MGIFGCFSNFDKCRLEAADDLIFGRFMKPIVLEKCVKFRDPCLNCSWEIPTEASEAVFSTVFFCYNCRPEVDNDVISDVAVDNVSMDVRVKFGDSRSNFFRDIGGADLISNERTNKGQHQVMDRSVTIVVAAHRRRQKSMGNHHSRCVCRNIRTTPGRHGNLIVFRSCWIENCND